MFERIILPIDKSNKSINTAKKAIELAKKLNVKLTAIYSINENVFTDTMTIHQAYVNKHYNSKKNSKQEKAHDFLNKIERFGNAKNVNVQTMLLEGSSEKRIVTEVNQNDLIIIGAKGTSAINRIFLSSLNEKLLHNAPSTVMIIRRSEDF